MMFSINSQKVISYLVTYYYYGIIIIAVGFLINSPLNYMFLIVLYYYK